MFLPRSAAIMNLPDSTPRFGITTKLSEQLGAYIGYAETNRTPSPVELTCADPADPCRLPNAFLAYPPLDVSAQSSHRST